MRPWVLALKGDSYPGEEQELAEQLKDLSKMSSDIPETGEPQRTPDEGSQGNLAKSRAPPSHNHLKRACQQFFPVLLSIKHAII